MHVLLLNFTCLIRIRISKADTGGDLNTDPPGSRSETLIKTSVSFIYLNFCAGLIPWNKPLAAKKLNSTSNFAGRERSKDQVELEEKIHKEGLIVFVKR